MTEQKNQYTFDTPFPLEDGLSYLLKSDHRDKSGKKSQWLIKPSEEVLTFSSAYSAGWHNESECWGLHPPNGEPDILGVTVDKRTVRLAKFVSNDKPAYWHGYPADYQTKTQDRPTIEILRSWLAAGLIKKHELTRIRAGHSCSLSD
jgi:hypothetical protein